MIVLHVVTDLSEAPVIVTAPAEVYNVSGSQVYLSCEAMGVPTPVLTWKRVSFSVTLSSSSIGLEKRIMDSP